MNVLQNIVNEIIEYLENKDEIREQLIKNSREIIRTCRSLVNKIHRRETCNIEEDFKKLESLVNTLKLNCQKFPDFYYSGIVQNALMEYYETILLYSFITGESLQNIQLSKENYVAFLLGLSDVVGELRRELVQALINDKIEQAIRYFNYMEQIYTQLSKLSFPNALTPGLRNKVDRIRHTIEASRNDILYVKKSREVIESLDKVIVKSEPRDS